MKISATTNQLGLAPIRIPKTRATYRACAHSPPWWQARSSGRRAPTHGYAPFPRRMPRLRNVRLSVKLGLSFGAILALTAAIIAVNVDNVKGLESAHNRVTKGVVPRVIAAQRAEAAFADLHFAQTSMVLTGGKSTRTRWTTSLSQTRPSPPCARPTATPARRSAWPVADAIKTWNILDAKLFAAVKRGDTGYAEQTVAGYADAAADDVITAIERYITQANRDRTPGRRALRRAGEHDQAHDASSSACWPCWPRWRLAVGLARHLGRRLRAVSQAAEALAEGDVDHVLSVSGRDEVGRTADCSATMVKHLRTLARAADRVAAGDLTVDVQPRSERDRLGAAFAGLVAELRAAVTPDVALGHQRRRRLASSSPPLRRTPAARSRRSPAPWATSPPAPSVRCAR